MSMGDGGMPGSKRTAPDGFSSWPTEPTISRERQEFLTARRAIKPNIQGGRYPFRDESGPIRLTRADVEWLLATHERHGPFERDPKTQRFIDQHLFGVDLRGADLRGVNLEGLPLAGIRAGLHNEERHGTRPEEREHAAAQLQGAKLSGAQLQNAILWDTHLEGADLYGANLEAAWLCRAHLDGVDLRKAYLAGADLRRATLSSITELDHVILGSKEAGCVSLADVVWGGANLATVDWSQVDMLGDERWARRQPSHGPRALADYKSAVRANRQLATVLRDQGMNEDAGRFTYRAQQLERTVLRKQGKWGQWLVSWFLNLASGYGYRLPNILVTYGTTLLLFTVVYWSLGIHSFQGESGVQALWDSFLVSLSAIHGRTNFEQLGAWSPAAWGAAVESVLGILIEGVFVAMLVQRFFGGR